MHGTEEWLPGQPLGNDRQSWSDELIGDLPNLYVYAANNPSESILAKRRGYGTIVSYNVPPYGRAGLYLELANLKDLVEEYRQRRVTDELKESSKDDLKCTIWSSVQKSGMMKDVPLYLDPSKKDSLVEGTDLPGSLPTPVFNDWVANLSNYLVDLQTRLFSSGLHVLGVSPSDDELLSYIEAYFGEKLRPYDPSEIVSDWRKQKKGNNGIADNQLASFLSSAGNFFGFVDDAAVQQPSVRNDAYEILDLLSSTTEEMDNLIRGLDGGFIPAAPGGDLLRDGPAVLPTGRNIHALDPYRMPSAGAWARGQRIAAELIRTHQEANAGQYPETIAVTLWGLDAIKTRGESVAIALSLVGAEPVKEGTGRIVRFDLIPLQRLGRPRIDVLASLSGIFR
jgi:magnesium chelatase subunit H